MLRYIVRRVLWGIALLFIVSAVIFLIIYVYLHGGTTGGVFTPQFSFGQSYYSQAPVKKIIFDRLPATALLVAGAVIFWLLMGIPVGIISSIKRRSLLDRTTMVTSLAFI